MLFEEYQIVIDNLLDIFPDNRIDIQPCPSLQEALNAYADGRKISEEMHYYIDSRAYDGLTVIMYYPELTITNESGKKHVITDVYAKLLFPDANFYLARTSYTSAEIASGYVHSHVPKGDFHEFHSFCLGNDSTPMRRIQANFRERLRKDKDKRLASLDNLSLMVQSLIIEMQRAMQVESREGGPYIYFSSINDGIKEEPLFIESSVDSQVSSPPKFQEFVRYYCSFAQDRFYFDGRNWQLDCDDASFITRVTNAARSFPGMRSKSFYTEAYYINGMYWLRKDGRRNRLRSNTTDWQFKGNHLPITVRTGLQNAVPVQILAPTYIYKLYNFMMNLINAYYANKRENKDNVLSRGHKIATSLIKAL